MRSGVILAEADNLGASKTELARRFARVGPRREEHRRQHAEAKDLIARTKGDVEHASTHLEVRRLFNEQRQHTQLPESPPSGIRTQAVALIKALTHVNDERLVA